MEHSTNSTVNLRKQQLEKREYYKKNQENLAEKARERMRKLREIKRKPALETCADLNDQRSKKPSLIIMLLWP